MTNKYIIALALMLGVVFAGHVSAQLTTVGTSAETAQTEATKAADDAAIKSDDAAIKAAEADKAAKKEDEQKASDKDAKKDLTKDRAIQSCGGAPAEHEGDEE